jgi:hypothetical protein
VAWPESSLPVDSEGESVVPLLEPLSVEPESALDVGVEVGVEVVAECAA